MYLLLLLVLTTDAQAGILDRFGLQGSVVQVLEDEGDPPEDEDLDLPPPTEDAEIADPGTIEVVDEGTEEAEEGAEAARFRPPTLVADANLRTSGSLWQASSGRQLLGMSGNARQVGDLVTVLIREETSSALGASTTSQKANSREGSIGSLFGLETSIANANPNLGGSIGFEVGSEANFEGGGNTSASVAVEATVTCQVMEVMPSGILVIKGYKEVRNYKETQYVTLVGMVRPQDIQIDNTVSSELLADATIEVHGRGSISERTRPGVGTRVLDVGWPF